MDTKTIMDVATVTTKLKMWPYFDVANYVIMCSLVREDNPTTAQGNTLIFNRKHPFACYIASMLMCFAGGIVCNLVLGEPLVAPFANQNEILVASLVWYIVNYSPFDLAYKLIKFLPVRLVLFSLKEVQRTYKIHHGVIYATKLYPNSLPIIFIIGTLKGSAANIFRFFERCLLGVWTPSRTEFMNPTFALKGSAAAAVVFMVERRGLIQAPHAFIYLGVVVFLLCFRLASLLVGIHDPFLPFENLFCAVFMGGFWDTLKRAVSGGGTSDRKTDGRPETKTKEDKKKD